MDSVQHIFLQFASGRTRKRVLNEMTPSPMRKEVFSEQRTRRKTRASNVLIENLTNMPGDNLTTKLRTRKRDDTNDNLLLSAKQTKRNTRKRRQTSSVKQTTQKDTSPKTEKVKTKLFKQSLSTEDIANILNSDAPVTSSVSSEWSNTSIRASKTIGNSIHVKDIVNNTLSEANMVTPKSSPIVVTLTPHRSRKTPKKSPIVSSPKSHTKTPLRLLKTPRKLAITTESQANSNKASPEIFTPEGTPKMESSERVQSIHNSLERKKSSEKKIKEKRSFTPNFKPTVRRFSKSPKIVIRTPKSKSKYKSPKVKLSTGKRSHSKVPTIRISPLKKTSLLPSRSSLTPNTVKTPKAEKLKSSLSPDAVKTPKAEKLKSSLTPDAVKTQKAEKIKSFSKKAVATAAKTFGIKIPNEMSTSYAAAILNQPKVILESVPGSILNEETIPTKGGMKPKRIVLSVSMTSTPLPASKISPAATSSPFHWNLNRSDRSSSGKLRVSNTSNKSLQMLDESQPSLLCDSLLMNSKDNVSESFSKKSINKAGNESYVIEAETKNPANETYELIDPKTPNLRHKCRKRSSLEAELPSPSSTAKKAYKVRFANPLFNRSSSKTTPSPYHLNRPQLMNMSCSKHARVQTPISIYKSKARQQHTGTPSLLISANKKFKSATMESQSKSDKTASTILKGLVDYVEPGMQEKNKNAHFGSSLIASRKSAAMTNGITKGLTKTDTKKKSLTLPTVSTASPWPIALTKSRQTSSVKKVNQPQLSLSAMKKSDIKTPIARKIPNFAQIHQKKFDEMESLVDARSRIAKRHVALSSMMKSQIKPKTTDSNGVTSRSSKDGIYNRFGFKLRKSDAMNLITKSQHVRPSIQEKNRALLKGIRVNRRFELQMKLRNINI